MPSSDARAFAVRSSLRGNISESAVMARVRMPETWRAFRRKALSTPPE